MVDRGVAGRAARPRVQTRSVLLPGVPGPSPDMHHLLQEGGFHAACAELIHPERSLMLQRGAPRVEGEIHIIVQQAADGCHVNIREPHQPSREVRGVVEGAEDASKLGVEQVLRQRPERKEMVLQIRGHGPRFLLQSLGSGPPHSQNTFRDHPKYLPTQAAMQTSLCTVRL